MDDHPPLDRVSPVASPLLPTLCARERFQLISRFFACHSERLQNAQNPPAAEQGPKDFYQTPFAAVQELLDQDAGLNELKVRRTVTAVEASASELLVLESHLIPCFASADHSRMAARYTPRTTRRGSAQGLLDFYEESTARREAYWRGRCRDTRDSWRGALYYGCTK